MPGQAQPDVMPFLRFRCDDCIVLENGLSPSTVIDAPTPLQLRMDVGFDGTFTALLHNQKFTAFHHVERVEDGVRKTLQGGTFVVPAPGAAAHITVASPSLSTGAAGSGADFEIAPGFDAGTFRILTHVHADDPLIRPIVSGFHDGLVIEIT
jgi:hypothetical protein